MGIPRAATVLAVLAVLVSGCGSSESADLETQYERQMSERAAQRAQAERDRPTPRDEPAAISDPDPAEPETPDPEEEDADVDSEEDEEVEDEPPAFEGTDGTTDGTRPSLRTRVLTDVRAALNDGFDRVVFEFEGEDHAGYHIEYLPDTPRECGSGDLRDVPGDAWLKVRMQPARAHRLEDGDHEVTVTDRDQRYDLPTVRAVTLTCDFEGQVEWVLGLSSPVEYRVLELEAPGRVVVDVLHL